MYERKPRKFRYNSNIRRHRPRNDNMNQRNLQVNSFNNGRSRNNFKSNQSPEKMVEKYMSLAKEALSSGDRTLSENYFQHADHFIRILDERKVNHNQNKVHDITDEIKTSNIISEEKNAPNQDQNLKEIEEKKE